MHCILGPKMQVYQLTAHQGLPSICKRQAQANPNPDADRPPPRNVKRSPPKVELSGWKTDEERDPEIDRQLERIPQDEEQFRPQERAPKMSRQELAMQL
uniref:Uncharacterized protein n=1 Tax=Romanomermis culicivorax TaxID=13658 RepID=A0A915ILQ2_ROMCU